MDIILTDDELKKCLEFSIKCAENQQDIEFGQSDTKPRAVAEIGRDNYIGKIAEVAFAKMLYNEFGISIDLDFEYRAAHGFTSIEDVMKVKGIGKAKFSKMQPYLEL